MPQLCVFTRQQSKPVLNRHHGKVEYECDLLHRKKHHAPAITIGVSVAAPLGESRKTKA